MTEPSWHGDPDYREGSTPEPSANSKRRYGIIRRAIMRALIGNGAGGQESHLGADQWDIIHLPLGGRIKVTTAQNMRAQQRVMHWVLTHQERRHWGAAAYFEHWPKTGITVSLPLDDFALIVGRLRRLEQEHARRINAITDDNTGGATGS